MVELDNDSLKFIGEIMAQIYHIGECPLCKGYGRMELLYTISVGKITAVCEECLLEFATTSDYKNNVNGYRVLCYNSETSARPATIEEIEGTEWYPFVSDKF